MNQDQGKYRVESEINSTISGQKIQESGRVHIPKYGWPIRFLTIMSLSVIIAYSLSIGIGLQDPWIILATIMPIESLLVTAIGWIFYKNPLQGNSGNELVSVVIPVYNQKNMISIVIDAIANSTYRNLEIIAVNDGSNDGTKEILDDLGVKYPPLKIIHKKNSGKRGTNLVGFNESKGKFIVFIDSDSVIDQYAIEEFVKTFNGNSKVGGLVGHANVWNSKKNIITKIQDSWYDFSFNIVKTSESTLNNVVVCSGCLAAYRREAIENFVPLWRKNSSEKTPGLDDTKYFKTNPWGNKTLKNLSRKILQWSSQFDDAEDSVLTSQTLVDWKTKYVASARVYTEVPDDLNGFVKQQIRWKKGWVRATLFLMTFFWKKNPITAFVFYINLFLGFFMPVILLIVFVYTPIVTNQFTLPIMFALGIILIGFAQGLDFKLRDPLTSNWKYKPFANAFTGFLVPWLIIPALWSLKKSQWMTR